VTPPRARARRRALGAAVLGVLGSVAVGACAAEEPVVESQPVMQNAELPFRYPDRLWAQRVQGDVLLSLFIDSTGVPVADSTRVASSSGVPALDSAALAGAAALRFAPARRGGVPVPVALSFPVMFRHPEAPPLPGDSALDALPVRTPPSL
jgi:TonB family protein